MALYVLFENENTFLFLYFIWILLNLQMCQIIFPDPVVKAQFTRDKLHLLLSSLIGPITLRNCINILVMTQLLIRAVTSSVGALVQTSIMGLPFFSVLNIQLSYFSQHKNH